MLPRGPSGTPGHTGCYGFAGGEGEHEVFPPERRGRRSLPGVTNSREVGGIMRCSRRNAGDGVPYRVGADSPGGFGSGDVGDAIPYGGADSPGLFWSGDVGDAIPYGGRIRRGVARWGHCRRRAGVGAPYTGTPGTG